jgi:cytochrome c biogenesis protein CcmG, thiol:disulfide interchange protein DsbE
LPEEVFHVAPPVDARQVARFRPQERELAAAFTLLGKPAPSFGLLLLDGSRVVLTKLKGSIVLLDFWAGQYDPCRLSMIMLEELGEKYKGKGLAVCAINSGDTVERVRRMVAEANVRIPVALDTNLTVGNRYGVSTGPHFVLIGRDGRIQFIHAGQSTSTKALLEAKIKALLAGEDLASQGDEEVAPRSATMPARP